eukprot:CAMPEP_0204227250 /NCGR_PEP_ID=MMETSP0361-20130328/85564_1 /ASSEMBLY_ACC=CAM_ASM_000343 /TAXON_ID=268821 /ORGANISM="Scrippsiella Hangoei, Strain SHTV-5" /LENGTH=69 /DNA_ID=CAMNT_0051194633 /DNA_START=166 /DNA_END=371 /DNA_ORIENTATION=+
MNIPRKVRSACESPFSEDPHETRRPQSQPLFKKPAENLRSTTTLDSARRLTALDKASPLRNKGQPSVDP